MKKSFLAEIEITLKQYRTSITVKMAEYDYTVIESSIYDEKDGIYLFNAFNKYGNCFEFYVDFNKKIARKQALSSVTLHDAIEVNYIFF